jgi:hypothetical protein
MALRQAHLRADPARCATFTEEAPMNIGIVYCGE